MAFHALPVIGSHQSGLKGVLSIKGPAVAAHTIGRFFRCRAVVMATLANRALFVVKIIRQFVIFDVIEQCLDNFTVRKLYRFILIHQGLDRDNLRYFLVIIRHRNGLTGFKGCGSHHFLFGRLNLMGDPGWWNHVAIFAGSRTLLAFFFKGRVTAGTSLFIQFGFMTAHTALIHV